jgi:actin related protein 2/3 complex subunit 2
LKLRLEEFVWASPMSTSLLHLATTNPTVVHRVSAFLASAASAAPRDDDHRIGDFDGCYWKLEQTASAPGRLGVCLEVPNFAAYRECVKLCNGHPSLSPFPFPTPAACLGGGPPPPPLTRFSSSAAPLQICARLGVDAHLQTVYGPMLVPARSGASVSLSIDASASGGGGGGGGAGAGAGGDLAQRVAALRAHVVAFPFLRAMSAVLGGRGAAEPPLVLRPRPREPVFVLCRADRVLVIFHVTVAEPTDRAVARTVAQELTEAYRAVNNAPPVSWSEREPPMELKGLFPSLDTPASEPLSIGYITFTIFPASYKTDPQRFAAAAHLAGFRAFLLYHLKAAKTYLHARMRSRAEGLQKVLNRALPDAPAEKKLASGRAFVAKGGAAAVMAAGGGGAASARGGGGGP